MAESLTLESAANKLGISLVTLWRRLKRTELILKAERRLKSASLDWRAISIQAIAPFVSPAFQIHFL
jgi:predicted DNA-binding protein (UPF0251 family)